jgi:hypothetical protein
MTEWFTNLRRLRQDWISNLRRYKINHLLILQSILFLRDVEPFPIAIRTTWVDVLITLFQHSNNDYYISQNYTAALLFPKNVYPGGIRTRVNIGPTFEMNRTWAWPRKLSENVDELNIEVLCHPDTLEVKPFVALGSATPQWTLLAEGSAAKAAADSPWPATSWTFSHFWRCNLHL